MNQTVDLRNADEPRDVIHQAAQHLVAGEIVVFPTETFYTPVAHALNVAGVATLQKLADGEPLTLLARSAEEVLDYIPVPSPLEKRFLQRCWPGPVALQFSISPESTLLTGLADEIQEVLLKDQSVTIRVSQDEALSETLRLIPGPLVTLTETADFPATAADAGQVWGTATALTIENGAGRYAQPVSRVKVHGNEWEMLQEGVISSEVMKRLSSELWLFICTGNTCRSPMAEGLCKHLLAQRLDCPLESLVERGYIIASAGVAAYAGAPAAPETIELLREVNVDLTSHLSQPCTPQLLDQADRLFTMTRQHRQMVLATRPDLASRVEVLSPENKDVPDPIGGGMKEYESCRAEIEASLQQRLDQILGTEGQPSS